MGRQPGEGEIGQDRGGRKAQQHQQPGGVELCRRVIAEGKDGQLDEEVAANRKAIVDLIGRGAGGIQGLSVEAQEVVGGREIRRHGQMACRPHTVGRGSVEVPPVAAEQEHRRQRQQQERERKPRRIAHGCERGSQACTASRLPRSSARHVTHHHGRSSSPTYQSRRRRRRLPRR